MTRLVVLSLALAGVRAEAALDSAGSYSHYLDTRSFIYNSGLGAAAAAPGPATQLPVSGEERPQEKREAGAGPGLYPPYQAAYPWLVPAYPDVYRRSAGPDLNGAPAPATGLAYPPGYPPVYGYPGYLAPYYPHLRHYAPPAADREAAPAPTPVYVPPSPAPVYRYNPAPLPATTPVPVYRYSPILQATPPPATAPAPSTAPHPPVYLPPRLDVAALYPAPPQLAATPPQAPLRPPQSLPVPTYPPPPQLPVSPAPAAVSRPQAAPPPQPRPFRPAPGSSGPVLTRNPSLMSSNLQHNQQRLEEIIRNNNQGQRMSQEPPGPVPDQLPPPAVPRPRPAPVNQFIPPAPAPLSRPRPTAAPPQTLQQQRIPFNQNQGGRPVLIQPPRPPTPPPPPRPPPTRASSAARGRGRESRALQKLLDVAGESWNADADIATNLLSSGHVAAASFTCPAREGNFPDPATCSGYYTCDHGVAHARSCGAGLVWNTGIQQCDWRASVDCRDTP